MPDEQRSTEGKSSKGKTHVALVSKAKNVFSFKTKNSEPPAAVPTNNDVAKAVNPPTFLNQTPRTSLSTTRRRLTIFNAVSTFGEDGAKATPVEPHSAQKLQSQTKNAKTSIVSGYSAVTVPGESSLLISKKVNQDTHLEVISYGGDDQNYFFSVMDGHGVWGHVVSRMIKDRLATTLETELGRAPTVKSAITKSFKQLNDEIVTSSVDCNLSGSTCVAVLIRNKFILTANVGDSRAIIGQLRDGKWQAHALSHDHKPDSPGEWNRIVAAGGRVEPMFYDDGEAAGPPRVWVGNALIPGLAMSRSFGDLVAASVGVISEPEIMEHLVTSCDKFMIVASDGIWEFIGNQEAVSIASQYFNTKDHKKAADELVKEAHARWHKSEGLSDDITCTVVFFQQKS